MHLIQFVFKRPEDFVPGVKVAPSCRGPGGAVPSAVTDPLGAGPALSVCLSVRPELRGGLVSQGNALRLWGCFRQVHLNFAILQAHLNLGKVMYFCQIS